MKDFDIGLQKHLNKCELEYRAKEYPNGSTVDWLAPCCGSVQEIASYLRYLGFRILEIMDDEPWPGEKFQWVETTSGIIVYCNSYGTAGLVAASSRRKNKRR